MSNPVYKNCLADQWTKVATNITTGFIHKKNEQPQEYLQMYKMTGGVAPTTIDEGIPIFINDEVTEPIEATAGIDVYIWCVTLAGRVRVDV